LSFKHTAAAWKIDNLSAPERLTLLALAEYANDVGVCWPSQGTLAQRTGLSERCIRASLASLETKGTITRRSRSTQNGRKPDVISLKLQLAPDAACATGNSLQPAPDAPQPAPDAGEPIREAVRKDSPSVRSGDFEDFWKAYPKRDGPNNRTSAEEKFNAAVKSGVVTKNIIEGARRYAAEMRRLGKEKTQYVTNPKNWLCAESWKDYAPAPAATTPKFYYAKFDSLQLEAWDTHWRKTKGKSPPHDRGGGWFFESEWPPGYSPPPQSVTAPATNVVDLSHAVTRIAA
jgi:hypothetical protein